MIWPFSRKPKQRVGIRANSVTFEKGVALIDVRGQTCPGYLLAINKAVEALDGGTTAKLLISYPPCGDDVHAWSREKGVEYLGIAHNGSEWEIRIRKPESA